jgi:hypothetical protein
MLEKMPMVEIAKNSSLVIQIHLKRKFKNAVDSVVSLKAIKLQAIKLVKVF